MQKHDYVFRQIYDPIMILTNRCSEWHIIMIAKHMCVWNYTWFLLVSVNYVLGIPCNYTFKAADDDAGKLQPLPQLAIREDAKFFVQNWTKKLLFCQ